MEINGSGASRAKGDRSATVQCRRCGAVMEIQPGKTFRDVRCPCTILRRTPTAEAVAADPDRRDP